MSLSDEVTAKATERQQRAADPASSAWVSANAGSGKTRVLIDRVARLLLAGNDPSRILCITYTKAAAAEMSSRLFKRLGEWSTSGDETLKAEMAKLGEVLPGARLREARSLFARALETPGGLKIETIHAFCQRVLQRFPLEAGISPDFAVIDERGSALLLEEARKDLFLEARSGNHPALATAVADLLERCGESNFAQILEDGIRSRTKLETFLDECEDVQAAVRERFDLGVAETFERVEVGCFEDARTETQALKALANAMLEGTDNDARKAGRLFAFFASPSPASWDDYLGVFLTDKRKPQKTVATKNVLGMDPAFPEIIARETDRVQEWDQKLRAARIADDTISALAVLKHLLERYAALKKLRSELDYDDLITCTLELLRGSANVWVHFKLDGGIDHVLIDEAQDTSPSQWEIVRRLAGEFFALELASADRRRTIFAVGDQKQSIYSFQGAEPRRFHEMSELFGTAIKAAGHNWAPVEMQVSFRSTSEILQVVDAAFASDGARAALTAQGEAVKHEAQRLGHSGYVEFAPPIEAKKAPDTSVHVDWTLPVDTLPVTAPEIELSNRIAGRIKSWIDKGAPLGTAPAPSRAIDAGDVLILVRQRGALYYEMIRALGRAGLPVAGGDRLVLRDQIAFLDLDALGRFCLHRGDDLALAEVLRGPFLDLKEAELFALAHGRKGSLWRALRDASGPRLVKMRAWLENAITLSQSLRPFEFYQRVLSDGIEDGLTPRQLFAERLGVEAEDVINEFLALALAYERDHASTLQGLLAHVKESAEEIKRDMEEAQGRIRVMTVHGAKGLEAPIVFLVDTCTIPRASVEKWLLEPDGNVPLLRARAAVRDDIETAIAAKELERQRQEYQRQLYVAMTRAQERLYISGVKMAQGRGYKGSWHESLADIFGELPDAWRRPSAEGDVLALGKEAEGEAARVVRPGGAASLPAWVKKPAPREEAALRQTPSTLVAEEENSLPVFAPLAGGNDPFLRGRAIHKLLQLLPDIAERERTNAARRILRLAPYRALADTHEELIGETLRLMQDERFAAVFGAGSRAEVPVSGIVTAKGGRKIFVSGQIDRLVVTPERILIVDFKTNRPAPKGPESVARAYIAQMAAYALLLEKALPRRRIESALLFTSVPRLIPLALADIDVTAITGKSA